MNDQGPAHGDRKDIAARHNEGWFAALKSAWIQADKDNAGIVAAGVAYYAFLAIVPLLGALVLTYGLVADPQTVAQHAQTLAGTLPQSAADLITEQLEAATQTASGTKGLGLILALAIALFGARKGAGAIVKALDIAYDLDDERSFLKKTLLALLITLGAILGLGLVAGAVTVTGMLSGMLAKVASYLVIFASAVLGGWALYRFAPDRDPPAPHFQLPGAVFFALAALLLTIGFGFYVANFGSYNATYGSLGAVVVLLTWLYLTAYALLIGAELNAPAECQNRQD